MFPDKSLEKYGLRTWYDFEKFWWQNPEKQEKKCTIARYILHKTKEGCSNIFRKKLPFVAQKKRSKNCVANFV